MDGEQIDSDHPGVWGRKACEGLKQASTEQLEKELEIRAGTSNDEAKAWLEFREDE